MSHVEALRRLFNTGRTTFSDTLVMCCGGGSGSNSNSSCDDDKAQGAQKAHISAKC